MFTDEAETSRQRQHSTNCIVCNNSLDSKLIVSDDLSQTLRSHVQPSDLHRQELFELFCDYMELDHDSFTFSYYSDPLQSTFPFCQVCEVMLMDLCELHDEMKHLVSRATQIKARLVRLVLESSNSKYIPSISSDTDSEDTEIIRKIITDRYTTKVVIQSLADPITGGEKSRTLKRKPNPGAKVTTKVKRDFEDNGFDFPTCDAVSFQCPSPDNLEEWEDINGSSGSSSVHVLEQQPDYPAMSSSTATTNNPVKNKSSRFLKMEIFAYSDDCEVTYSKPKEETILKPNKKPKSNSTKAVGRNYKKIGPNKYEYAGEFPFGKIGDNYRCDLCCIYKPSLAKILFHIRRCHHRPRASTKQYHKFVEIQPNKFIYGNKFAVYKLNNHFHCCSCTFKTITRNKIVQHLREKHLTTVEDGCLSEELGDEDSSSIQKNLDLDSLFYPIVELNEHLNENNSCKDEEGVEDAGKLNEPKSDLEVEDRNDGEGEMDLDQDAPQSKKKSWKEISDGKFLYRERFPFSKLGDQYFCNTPPCTNMSPTFRQMLTHVRRCHIYERTPGKARIRFSHKLIKTGPGQFIYANQYPVELSDGVYSCGTCQKTSTNKYKLIEHVRTKHLIKTIKPSQDLICETCGKVYTCRRSLSRHKRSHTSQSGFKCNICGNSFARPEYLRRHMETHMGDEVKKHVCEFCGKKFRAKIVYIGHISTHTGEKGFHCSHCPMVFGTYNSMSYHRVRTHGKVGNS